MTVQYESTTRLSLDRTLAFSWQRVTATVRVDSAAPEPPAGTVVVTIDGVKHEVPLVAGDDGKLTYKLPKLSRGLHLVKAYYGGSDAVAGSESGTRLVLVLF